MLTYHYHTIALYNRCYEIHQFILLWWCRYVEMGIGEWLRVILLCCVVI